MLGIKKDKITPKNGFANMLNDGLHSYYARYFDFLITADKSLTEKSKALYGLLNVKTIVLTVEEFIDRLPEIAKTSDLSVSDFFRKFLYDINNADRKETNFQDQREQTIICTKNRYFNFFDVVFEVKEDGYCHYFLRKLMNHYLSAPNYRETGMIINRCVDIFGPDLLQRGYFDFEKEVTEIEEDKWGGRAWRINEVLLILEKHYALKEICMLITPVEAFKKSLSTPPNNVPS